MRELSKSNAEMIFTECSSFVFRVGQQKTGGLEVSKEAQNPKPPVKVSK